jgi:hypothetical protein
MLKLCLLLGGAVLAAGCGDEASIQDVGSTPYHLELRLLDPATGQELEATEDSPPSWPVGLPDGPVVEIIYWADRSTPALSVLVRVSGASLVQGEDTGLPEAEATIPLQLVDTQHRTVRVDLLPPVQAGRAVVTVLLGGEQMVTEVDFAVTDVTLAVPVGVPAVADGLTEVPVTVTGVAGQIVDLETSLGTFLAPSYEPTASIILQPVATDSTDGSAVLGLVSDADGPAIVSVGGSRANWIRIDFQKVALVLGTPAPIGFAPGRVVHEICVATNTAKGELVLTGTSIDAEVLDADPLPVLAATDPLPASCPSGVFAGYALFRWAASGASDTLTASWSNPDSAVTVESSARLTGETFAGYGGSLDSTALGVGDPYPLLFEAHLTYLAVGGLTERPAGDVPVTFLVLSGLDATELTADENTAADGTATAVYEVARGDVLQVFLQPEGWSSILLGTAP